MARLCYFSSKLLRRQQKILPKIEYFDWRFDYKCHFFRKHFLGLFLFKFIDALKNNFDEKYPAAQSTLRNKTYTKKFASCVCIEETIECVTSGLKLRIKAKKNHFYPFSNSAQKKLLNIYSCKCLWTKEEKK